MTSGRFLQIKSTYYNPKFKKNINIIVKDYYTLIPMALRNFGKCFELDCHKQVMPYDVYIYGNVNIGAASIQSALGILKDDDDTQHCLDNLETWDCVLGNGMDNKMFDIIKYSSIYCNKDCKLLMDGYEVFRGWMLEQTKLDIDGTITI